MPLLLYRFMGRIERHGWIFPLSVIIGSYLFGQFMMVLFEPIGAPIRNPLNYTWYYFISGTSTGYGDLYPVTTGGRVGGVVIIFAGLSAGVLFLSNLSAIFSRRGRRRMTGDAPLHLKDHVIIVGYDRDYTLDLIIELRGDSSWAKAKVAVCYLDDHTIENLDPKVYDLVRYDPTALTRADAIYARTIVVATGDDDRSIREMIRINGFLTEHSVDNIHVLMLAMNSREQVVKDLERVNREIELLSDRSPASVANAIQNPGMATFNELLATNLSDTASYYRINIPEGAGYWNWLPMAVFFLRQGISLSAVADCHRPKANLRLIPDDQLIRGGQSLIVIAKDRPKAEKIDWATIPTEV